MKLLLGQEEGLRHGLETQVKELQMKLKQGQSPEPAKEILLKVGDGCVCVLASVPCSIPRSAHPFPLKYTKQEGFHQCSSVCFQADSPRMIV